MCRSFCAIAILNRRTLALTIDLNMEYQFFFQESTTLNSNIIR